MIDFIYLASQSPRRSQLLDQLGVAYQILVADQDESAAAEALEIALQNEAPMAYVKRVTALKLEAAVQRLQMRGLPLAPVLCADTTVAMGRVIYGKPSTAADAARMLRELSGQTHRVLTSVAIGYGAGHKKRVQTVCESQVTFAKLTPADVANYVATGEPLGKAGSYAVQGRAAAFIEKISGSYSGIMGLPLFETAQLLKQIRFKH
ncbi:MAG TPA: Maf family protein [Burkholderiaceae bacterium]|nr:Maf family protein [Burkholderiaceae bacterium]